MNEGDPSGYLPPHELRALFGNVGAREDVMDAPRAPSLATSSPGLAAAAAAPTGVSTIVPPDDAGAIHLAISRALGEELGGVSYVPFVTMPDANPQAPSALTAPSAPATPSWPDPGSASVPPPSPLSPTLSQAAPSSFSTASWPASTGFSPPATPPATTSTPTGTPTEPSTSTVQGVPAPRPSSTPGAFSPHVVRRDFPILEERIHGTKRLVWLDNAATTQKPRAVIDRLSHFYEHENSNVHRAAHALAARATDAYESARETTRKFLNAPSTNDIVFVRGTTEAINLVAKSWGKRYIERGDEIVITHLEHHANIVPWQMLCAETGARLRVAPVDERGDVILEEYEKLMCSRTKLVSFTQVSNALGTVTPAREMIEIAHRWGATVLLDGAQAVSHMPVDVQALDADFYVFSGHKVFAPTGIGALYGKPALLAAMPPWQGGGNMIADVTFERTQYQPPPWKFEAGTGNIADAAGLGAALDYVMRLGMPSIERYEHELLCYATGQLATVPGLRMIGNARHKAGVLSFVLDGRKTEEIGAELDKDGIAVRSGHHCAQPILRRYGLEATVRASLAFYNTCEDIDALVSSLRRIQASA